VQWDRSQGGLRGSERTVVEHHWPGPEESFELEYAGTARRFSGGTPPRFGFFVEIENPDARIRLDVATYQKTPIAPIQAGTPLTVRLRGTPRERTFEIRDEQGTVFAMFVWTANAAHEALDGVEVHAVEPEAYRVEASDADLCRREDVHWCVRVHAGTEVQRLCPGESSELCSERGNCQWVVLVDARETEVHGCGRKPPPRSIWVQARVPPDAGAR